MATLAIAAGFVTLLAARPVVGTIVVASSVIVGTLAGLAIWRRRSSVGKLPPLRELVFGGPRAQRKRSRARPRGAQGAGGGGGCLVAALLIVGLIVVVLRAGGGCCSSVSVPPMGAFPASYDATATFDSDRDQWAMYETMDVPLPEGSGPPASLSGNWAYQGPGASRRGAVYARNRTIAADVSFWPFRRITNVIDVPHLTLPTAPRNGSILRAPPRGRIFIARDGSYIRLTGPRRLIRDTTPAATKRTGISRHREVVELRLTGLRYNPDRRQIEADLVNGIGRSAPYTWAVKYGPIPIGLIFTTVITFFVNRALKRRFGDGSQAPAPAVS